MRRRMISHPVGCEELNKMNYRTSYEVNVENHETLDTIMVFECDDNFYHLDMLFNDELNIEINEEKYTARV